MMGKWVVFGVLESLNDFVLKYWTVHSNRDKIKPQMNLPLDRKSALYLTTFIFPIVSNAQMFLYLYR